MTLSLVPGLNCPQEMPAGSDQAPFGQGRPLTSATIDLDNPSATLSPGSTLKENRGAWAQRKLPDYLPLGRKGQGALAAVGRVRDSEVLNSGLDHPPLKGHRGCSALLQGPVDSCWSKGCWEIRGFSRWTPHLNGRVKPPEWVAWGPQEEAKGLVDVSYQERSSFGLSAQPGLEGGGGGKWLLLRSPQGAGKHSEARCVRGP